MPVRYSLQESIFHFHPVTFPSVQKKYIERNKNVKGLNEFNKKKLTLTAEKNRKKITPHMLCKIGFKTPHSQLIKSTEYFYTANET